MSQSQAPTHPKPNNDDNAATLRLLLELQAQLMGQLAEQNKALGDVAKNRVAVNDTANAVRNTKRELKSLGNDISDTAQGVMELVLVVMVAIVTLAIICKLWVAPTIEGWIGSLNPFGRSQPAQASNVKAMGDAPPLVENGQIQLTPTSSKTAITITSGFGMRTHPIHGTEKMHSGVDLGIPTGVPLFMPVSSGNVECLTDRDGYGLFADVSIGEGKVLRLAHLSDCTAGTATLGKQIAMSGNSGGSTGAHLHLEVREVDKPVQPTLEYALGVLNGVDLTAINRLTNQLYPAIVKQESGGNHQASNHASGDEAIGKTQIMEYNIFDWSAIAVGYQMTVDAFRGDAAKQEQISRYQMMQFVSEQLKATKGDEASTMRRVAAIWYSGNPDRISDYSAIPGQPNSPSVGTYVDEVMNKMENAK